MKLHSPTNMLKAILFDLGDTLIHERVDDVAKLDTMVLRLQPHTQAVLKHLSSRYRIGIVTDTETSTEASVRAAICKLGLAPFISAIVTSTDMGVTKPHRAMFLEALRRLDVNPSEALMVGNDPDRDIHGARQLGIISILYRGSKSYQLDSQIEANYVIDSLKQVIEIADHLSNQNVMID